jgi:glycosyltransferase involved in cell wall biosynthesis
LGADDLVAKLNRYTLFSKSKIFTLPTAIDTHFFKPKNRILCRKKLGISKKEKVVSFVGRVQYEKGSDYLLKIIKNNPDKKFILIGKLMDENYDKNELKNVLFVERANSEELVNYYNASDVFLFLSRSEGLGLAYREAMSCGIPAIVSDIEAIRLVEAAIKVPFDEKAIQEKIDYLFSLSQIDMKKLSKYTREYTVREFSEESLKGAHVKYFLDFN